MAFIPARGGSKGIVGKNRRLLAGIPLVAYSILAAKSSKLVDRVVVSTDCPEVARLSREWGAEVPFMRPENLASDSAQIGAALDYTLHRLDESGYTPEIVVELYPTSPFRPAGMIDELISHGRKAVCVQTVKSITRKSGRFFKCNGDSFGVLEANKSTNTQFLRGSGSGVVHNFRDNVYPWFFYVVEDQICNIDIDEPQDWALAEEILRRNLFRFGWES